MGKRERKLIKLMIYIALVLLGALIGILVTSPDAWGQPRVTTCESVILEVDGVYWNFPNSWINGAILCYDGPLDKSVHVVTIEREVTFKGSKKALEQLGVL